MWYNQPGDVCDDDVIMGRKTINTIRKGIASFSEGKTLTTQIRILRIGATNKKWLRSESSGALLILVVSVNCKNVTIKTYRVVVFALQSLNTREFILD